MKIVGKVLWWDRKDLNGIIVDAQGNEYYFDISVIGSTSPSTLKPGLVVQFHLNSEVIDVSCAMGVKIPPAKTKKRLEKEFKEKLQLAFQF